MLWVKNNPDNEPERTWKLGEPVQEDLGPVVSFLADAEELGMILRAMRASVVNKYSQEEIKQMCTESQGM